MSFADVRAFAQERRKSALRGVEPRNPADVDKLIDRALIDERLTYKIIGDDDIYAPSILGFLNRRGRLVGVSHRNSDEERRAVSAHEIGHWHLHDDPRLQLTQINFPVAGSPVEGYSDAELKEVQADVFAAEFLCPCDVVAREFSFGVRPAELARRLGLPQDLVLAQAAEALLGTPSTILTQLKKAPPDAVHLAVATASGSRVIVEGGLSSGKTTIVEMRVAHLLASGVSPASVAVFARSEGAAFRLRRAWQHLEGGVQVWTGTLLGYCKELLRKYPARSGLTSGFRILDDVAAITLLHGAAATIPSESRPTRWHDAARVYREITALKHGGYDLGERHLGVNDRPRTRRYDLVALYRHYNEALRAADAVDTADLAQLAAGLIDNDEIAMRIVGHHNALVIDDYEDTSAAEQIFLNRLSRRGAHVFATAGRSRSINVFRGAFPVGVRLFEINHDGADRIVLANSNSGIKVDPAAMRAIAASRRTGRTLRCQKTTVSITADSSREAQAIAREIAAWRRMGLPAHDQVVLARTHASLNRVARALRALGVAIRYDGEAFDSPEFTDLLAIMRLRSDRSGQALSRVLRFADYKIRPDEAAALDALLRRERLTAFEAAARLHMGVHDNLDLEPLAPSTGMARLKGDFAKLAKSPSSLAMVSTWLFELSDYLAGKDIAARTAIRWFLGVCEEHERQADRDDANLERRLRRLRSRSQDSSFWREDDVAPQADAVALMTIHAAQGRSFRGVHLAALPPGLGPRDPLPDSGEHAVFATAVSRARERLHLSRSLDDSERWEGRLSYHKG